MVLCKQLSADDPDSDSPTHPARDRSTSTPHHTAMSLPSSSSPSSSTYPCRYIMSLQSTFSSYRSRRTDSSSNPHTDSQASIRRRTIIIPPDSESEEEEDASGERREWNEREDVVAQYDQEEEEGGKGENPVQLRHGERGESVAMLDEEDDHGAGREDWVALLDSDEELESLESLDSPITSYPRHTHLPSVSVLPHPSRGETHQAHQVEQEAQAHSENQAQTHSEDHGGILLSDEEDFERVIDTLRLGSPPTTDWKRREFGDNHHDQAHALADGNANVNAYADAAGADDDDGDVLTMLLQRQQKMREDQNRAESNQVGAEPDESGLPTQSDSSQLRESQKSNSSVDRVEETIDSPANRR